LVYLNNDFVLYLIPTPNPSEEGNSLLKNSSGNECGCIFIGNQHLAEISPERAKYLNIGYSPMKLKQNGKVFTNQGRCLLHDEVGKWKNCGR